MDGEMTPQTKIAVTSDYAEANPGHRAANDALQHAAEALELALAVDWIPTAVTATPKGLASLAGYDGIFSAGGAYAAKNGALEAIRFAREGGWPFFGT